MAFVDIFSGEVCDDHICVVFIFLLGWITVIMMGMPAIVFLIISAFKV